MRWIEAGRADEFGNGRGTFERERRAALLAGYRIVPPSELASGELAQAYSASSGIADAVVIELLEPSAYGMPAGTRYAVGVALEPERGEE